MKKYLIKGLATALLAVASVSASAATYDYYGLFTTNGYSELASGKVLSAAGSAPVWSDSPQVYSGLEAAVVLFGGDTGDYRISTSRDVVNELAWYDGWGDHVGRKYAQGYSLDLSGFGYNGCYKALITCYNSAYSALIKDGFSKTNYVFKMAGVSPVPLPAAAWLFGSALLGFAGLSKRRKG